MARWCGDAAEGPLPQTKFVVSKALKVGLKPIVVINKVDRPDARPTEVINEVFDLFAALDASEEQLDFPILYGSAKQGWMADSPDGSHDAGMQPLFDLIVRHVAPPSVEEGPFRMIGTILEANPYLGRIITGRTIRSIKRTGREVLGAAARTSKVPHHENPRLPRHRSHPAEEPTPATSLRLLAYQGTVPTPSRAVGRNAAGGAADPPPTVSCVHRQHLAARRPEATRDLAMTATPSSAKPKAMSLRVVEARTRLQEVSGRGDCRLRSCRDHAPRGLSFPSRPPSCCRRTKPRRGRSRSGVVIASTRNTPRRRAKMSDARPRCRDASFGGNRPAVVLTRRPAADRFRRLATDTRGTAIMNACSTLRQYMATSRAAQRRLSSTSVRRGGLRHVKLKRAR